MRSALVLLAIVVTSLPAADKAEDQAKKVVGEFVTAVRGKDIDGLMKVVDVPWFHDGKKVIRERDELKKEFQEIFKKKDFATATYEVKEINRFGDVQGELNEQQRELLKGVMEKDDLVVTITLALGEKKDDVHLGVRFRKGEAKIVGLKD